MLDTNDNSNFVSQSESNNQKDNANTIGILQFFNYLHLLKETKRSGWKLKGITNGESVADHSFGVALMVLLMQNNNSKLDINR